LATSGSRVPIVVRFFFSNSLDRSDCPDLPIQGWPIKNKGSAWIFNELLGFSALVISIKAKTLGV
jgi:hypothetical protein